jgi:glycosyltransferase involved in cell wall biosynthesis
MKLSVVVPVFNEERHISNFVEYLMKVPSIIEREFIFVDDGSSDRTAAILKNLQNQYYFTFLVQPKNMGKGAAIRRGIQEARGEFIVIQDADFEYDPNDINSLIAPLMTNQCDVVYGSRFKKNGPQVHRTYHYFVNRILTILSNLLSGIYLTDMETCYKLFRADLVKAMVLKSNRFGVEVELTAYVAKTNARVFEFPISYYPRTKMQGKKINWKDGVAALGHLVRFNLLTKIEVAFHELPGRYTRELVRQSGVSSAPMHRRISSEIQPDEKQIATVPESAPHLVKRN